MSWDPDRVMEMCCCGDSGLLFPEMLEGTVFAPLTREGVVSLSRFPHWVLWEENIQAQTSWEAFR